MHRAASLLAAVSAFTAFSFVCPPVNGRQGTPIADLSELSAVVDHPLVPLASVPSKVFVGEESDPETGKPIAVRVEETVQPANAQIAGAAVSVVDVNDYHDGTLVKTTADYFAQGPDGTVYYLGERVDEYENGNVVGHEGAWLVGESSNQPGLFMPADPAIGDSFQQEQVPGIAEERSTVIASDQIVSTAAGRFAHCIVTRDADLPDGPVERKTYCPGVGLVREKFPGGHIELMNYAGPNAADSEVEVPPGAIDEGQDLLSGAAITLEESVAAAQAAVPGKVGEVDMKVADSGILFVVDVGSNEVSVDAETGEVLSVDPADESGSSTNEDSSADDALVSDGS
jgi:hypothetical protein